MSVPISAMRTRAVVSLRPRHGRQEADGGAKGAERVSNARFNRATGGLEGVDLRQVQFDHEPMMVGDPAMERVQQIRACRFRRPRVRSAEAIGIGFAGDQRR
jgi:hypothetical protein